MPNLKIGSVQPSNQSLLKTHAASVQSKLAKRVAGAQTAAPSAAAVSAAAAASPELTAWTAGRPNAEYTATTGTVTGSASSGAIKLSLKKGAAYNFSAGFAYSYSGGKPSFTMQVADSTGKIVASGKGNAVKWTATADGDYTITLGIAAGKGGSASFSSYKIDAVQSLSKLPAKSGDAMVDAVMAGGSYWWHPAGNVATLSATKISDTIRQLNGASSTVYYGFLDGSESYLSATDATGFAAMSDAQQSVVKTAFDYLSTLINVTFEHDESKANIEFGTNAQTSSAGYANYPLGNGANPSVLLLDNSDNTANDGDKLGTKGGYGWETLIHEIGHAMGLKHPGPYNAGGGKAPAPYLPTPLDNRAMSIMSYNNPVASQLLSVSGTSSDSGYTWSYSLSTPNPSTYQTYDLAALQYLYGANTSTTASDLSLDDGYADFQTLWAPQSGGVALDASATTRANLFDLRQGAYSSIGLRLTEADKVAEIKGKFTTLGFSATNAASAASAVYAKLKTSKGASKVTLDKALYDGRNNLALGYGSSFASVTGGSAADKFYASTYSTTIDGGNGVDTVMLQGTVKDWTIDAAKTTATSKSGTVISMKNVEAIAFYKSTEALVHK